MEKNVNKQNICFMCSNFTCIIHHCGLREHSDNWASDKDLHVRIILGKLRQFTWLHVVSCPRKYETLEIYLCSQSCTFLGSHRLILPWSFTYFNLWRFRSFKGKEKKIGTCQRASEVHFGESWGSSFRADIKTSSAVNFPDS